MLHYHRRYFYTFSNLFVPFDLFLFVYSHHQIIFSFFFFFEKRLKIPNHKNWNIACVTRESNGCASHATTPRHRLNLFIIVFQSLLLCFVCSLYCVYYLNFASFRLFSFCSNHNNNNNWFMFACETFFLYAAPPPEPIPPVLPPPAGSIVILLFYSVFFCFFEKFIQCHSFRSSKWKASDDSKKDKKEKKSHKCKSILKRKIKITKFHFSFCFVICLWNIIYVLFVCFCLCVIVEPHVVRWCFWQNHSLEGRHCRERRRSQRTRQSSN